MQIKKLVGIAALGLLSAGCYVLRPAYGVTPEVGSEVAFDVTDAGRVALGGAMGPEIRQIEGRLVEKSDGEYLLAVSSIRMIYGGEQVWRGERVRVRQEHLGTTYQRKFSAGRSIALGAVTVGGFAAFLVSRSLFTSGQDPETDPDPDGDTFVWP
jgi:hypothetical protein